jgi:hypothetical protein
MFCLGASFQVEALSSCPVRCVRASANQRDGRGFEASASRHKGALAEQGAQQKKRLFMSRTSSLRDAAAVSLEGLTECSCRGANQIAQSGSWPKLALQVASPLAAVT